MSSSTSGVHRQQQVNISIPFDTLLISFCPMDRSLLCYMRERINWQAKREAVCAWVIARLSPSRHANGRWKYPNHIRAQLIYISWHGNAYSPALALSLASDWRLARPGPCPMLGIPGRCGRPSTLGSRGSALAYELLLYNATWCRKIFDVVFPSQLPSLHKLKADAGIVLMRRRIGFEHWIHCRGKHGWPTREEQ